MAACVVSSRWVTQEFRSPLGVARGYTKCVDQGISSSAKVLGLACNALICEGT